MDQGEYVVIYNPAGQGIDISGFILTDLEGEFEIPGGTILDPESKYKIELPADGIQLSNSGDEVILLDNALRMVDCAIYGGSEYEGEGWQGSMLGRASEERIFRRFYLDKDTDTAYEWLPLKEYYRGQSGFMPSSKSFSGEVTVFVSPDCSLKILKKEIRNASVLRVNVYLFESQDIEREVVDVLSRGDQYPLTVNDHTFIVNFCNSIPFHKPSFEVQVLLRSEIVQVVTEFIIIILLVCVVPH